MPEAWPVKRENADGNAKQACENHRHTTEIDGDHRLFPLASGSDEKGQRCNEQCKAPATERVAKHGQQDDDTGPRQRHHQPFERHQHVEQHCVLQCLQCVEVIDVDPLHDARKEVSGRHMQALGHLLDGRNKLCKNNGQHAHRKCSHEMRLALPETKARAHGLRHRQPVGGTLAQAIEHQGQRDDGKACLDPCPDIEPPQRCKDIKSKAAGANHAGNDHHVEGKHDHLVHAHHQGLAGGGHQHAPQRLALRAAYHPCQVMDFWRHTPEAKQRDADHRRHGKDQGGDNGRRWAETKQHKNGHEIGKDGNGLHQVEQWRDEKLKPRPAIARHAHQHAKCHGNRRGHQDG